MALRASKRRSIPRSKFVYKPGTKVGGKSGAYPIDTPKRARAALAYSARRDTKGSYSTVRRAVNKRYPGITTRGKKR